MATKYTVGMCPSPVIDDALNYENRKDSISESKNDTSIEVTVLMCPSGNKCYEGLIVEVRMCPIGEECACSYSVDNLWWYDNGYCGITFQWNNPDKCLLREIRLMEIDWWDFNYQNRYIHEREGEISPTMLIYPDGDIRNKEGCRDCGIGGTDPAHEAGSELVYETTAMIPGQLYQVVGYFDDLSCGGPTEPVSLAYVVYQTTGLSSGRITGIVSSVPPMYTVEFYERSSGSNDYKLKEVNLYSVDYYDYEVDDAVMLAKIDTTFPDGSYASGINDSSVQQNSSDNDSDYKDYYYIVPYNKIMG